MDRETVERVKEELRGIAEEHDIDLEETIVFGSRVREDYTEESDVDILLVSPDFKGMATSRRSREFYLDWDYDKLPTPEFICLTPKEFRERRKKKPHIVRTAVEEGVKVV